jgi:hypothetical protein
VKKCSKLTPEQHTKKMSVAISSNTLKEVKSYANKYLLFIVGARGKCDYGALNFGDEHAELAIAKEYSTTDKESSSSSLDTDDSDDSDEDSDESSSSEESNEFYSLTITKYVFSSYVDRDQAWGVAQVVHEFIDYDDTKHSDVLAICGESYMSRHPNYVTWSFLDSSGKWVPLHEDFSYILECQWLLTGGPTPEKGVYFEHPPRDQKSPYAWLRETHISFDFIEMIAVWKKGKHKKRPNFDKMWENGPVRSIRRTLKKQSSTA